MPWHDRFNRSGFSRFINSPAGRLFRLTAGSGFFVTGYLFRHRQLGVAAMLWSVFPLSAGALDWCYISAALGGPLPGDEIRARYPAVRPG